MNEPLHEKVVKFVPGDLLWTKIGGLPFWPCLVTYDPATSVYVRPIKIRGKTQTSYHVQYFGQNAQHGWTMPGNSSSFPFKGEKDFYDHIEALKSKSNDLGAGAPKSLTIALDKFKVSSAHKEKWTLAVKEAEEAMSCSNAKERFQTYVFCFETKKTSPVNGASDLVNKPSSSAQPLATFAKRIKLSEESDVVCDVCHKSNIDFSCYACHKSFHLECVGLTKFPEKFKCIECISASVHVPSCHTGKSNKTKTVAAISPEQTAKTNDEACFVCQSSSGEVIKCSLAKCNKYYHVDCMHRYECTNKEKNICPYHTCLTCYRGNPKNTMARKGPMVKCTRCPTAFHSRKSCIAAGSVEISSQNAEKSIICPYHYVGKHNTSERRTCNLTVCAKCLQGGVLICCEACPNAFHQTCLDITIPSDEFICEDCENRRYLLYGMIVWVKVGKFRWWPAKILHPSDLPQNIKNQKHCEGEFAVHFYGTYDYSWTHSGRVFPYTEDHKTCKPTSKKLKEKYEKSLVEAANAFDEYLCLREHDSLIDTKPEAFRLIKVNRALPPAQIKVDKNYTGPCNCDPTKANPCGPESLCVNRLAMLECAREVCKAKDLCQNQMFQRRQYPKTKLIKTIGRGWGLAALEIITKGQFVIEYVGEIITEQEYQKRKAGQLAAGDPNYYFLKIDSQRYIDAGPMGNMSRFINHSCEPNCDMGKWMVEGDHRCGIFAVKDISPGEEITFDYQTIKQDIVQECFCGSSVCKGYIGEKPTTTNKASTSVDRSSIQKNILQTHNSNVSLIPVTNSASGCATNPVPTLDNPVVDSSLNVVSGKKKKKKEKVIHPICEPPRPIYVPQSMQPQVALIKNIEIEKKLKNTVVHLPALPFLRNAGVKCFICKNPGAGHYCRELGCGKTYHLDCVGLASVPIDDFICDIHTCSLCKKPSHFGCQTCTTSFCLNCWQKPLPLRFLCQLCQIKSRRG